MKIFVHFPTKAEEIRQLETTVAKMQADIILWKIQNINCPGQQKNMLIGGVIRDLMKSETSRAGCALAKKQEYSHINLQNVSQPV